MVCPAGTENQEKWPRTVTVQKEKTDTQDVVSVLVTFLVKKKIPQRQLQEWKVHFGSQFKAVQFIMARKA